MVFKFIQLHYVGWNNSSQPSWIQYTSVPSTPFFFWGGEGGPVPPYQRHSTEAALGIAKVIYFYSFLSLRQQCQSIETSTCRWNDRRTRSSADADNRLDAFSGQSRSTNMVPFHMLHIVSYCAIVTLSLRHFTIFVFKKFHDLEMGSKVTQGHWEWYHSIDCVWFPISVL